MKRKHNQRLALEPLEDRHLLAADMLSQVMTEPADDKPIADNIDEFLTQLQAGAGVTEETDSLSPDEGIEGDQLVTGDDLNLFLRLFYSIDGSGNNLQHPEWGKAGEELLRITTVDYADGISTPAGATRASARAVSNAIADQSDSITNNRALTDYVWQWGQFLDHDIDLTGAAEPVESFPIRVPKGGPAL